jgi:hypothetical protein
MKGTKKGGTKKVVKGGKGPAAHGSGKNTGKM